MEYWFWKKHKEENWSPIYAESEQKAKNKRADIVKDRNIIAISPIRPVSDDALPIMLKTVIKREVKKDG